MTEVKPQRFIMIQTGSGKDLESLEAKVTPVVNAYFNQGIYDVRVRLYLCKYKNQYIYTSRATCLGINKKNNKFVVVNKGSNKLVDYAVAYWKYDHARAKEIKWNTIIFRTDGYEMERPDTELDEGVEERAKLDAKDGIMWKLGREITNFLYRALVGSRNPKGMQKKDQKDNNEFDIVS